MAMKKLGTATPAAADFDNILAGEIAAFDRAKIELTAVAFVFVLGLKLDHMARPRSIGIAKVHLRPIRQMPVTSCQEFEQSTKNQSSAFWRTVYDLKEASGQHVYSWALRSDGFASAPMGFSG
jgi:hypothetical protein